MKVIYRITYPNGKIYIGQDRTDSIRVRAMVRTGDGWFAAGPPDVLNNGDELAAFQGRSGGVLLVIDPASGKTPSKLHLKSPPVFDGLIAAKGHLYMSTRDGRVIRFGD